MEEGLYEALITKLLTEKLQGLDNQKFAYHTEEIEVGEAALVLSRHISRVLHFALSGIHGKEALKKQIKLANQVIEHLELILNRSDLNIHEDLIEGEGKLLMGVFSKLNLPLGTVESYINQIRPSTQLSQSELFTGGAQKQLSLASELRKEIVSSNRIDLLVSFIKWQGLIVLDAAFEDFFERGGKLRVITTTYMGASDAKAIEKLSGFPNTEVRVSYNHNQERLHAKAYLFYRNSGFHTAYIGSSNFSRSALTDGLEWNVKLTTQEVPHILDKFKKSFESYWASSAFEPYDGQRSTDKEKLRKSLSLSKVSSPTEGPNLALFDIEPRHFQQEILEKLEVERKVHGHYKNLVVAATGTGKTVIGAFDFKRLQKEKKDAKLLFIAHRKEILLRSRATFCGVLKNQNFGDLWVDGQRPQYFKHVFASVQSLSHAWESWPYPSDYFDMVIIDEVHHLRASSYRPILDRLNPQILLGLTATPERMDGGDIVADFGHRIAAEIRLPEALNQQLLTPFHYFGVSDSIDLSQVRWERGAYQIQDLEHLYTGNHQRVAEILKALKRYTLDISMVRCLGFCATISHADFMAASFKKAGLKAEALHSKTKKSNEGLYDQLRTGKINYLFSVDMLNEGVDIPEADTLLFLRPTESITVFLQQLGRGLRLSEGKQAVTVLDFVGNARPEYDFSRKFRALTGRFSGSLTKEVEGNFPHAPVGCHIVLERKAKEVILSNIKRALRTNKKGLLQKIRAYTQDTGTNPPLSIFLKNYPVPLESIYKHDLWLNLVREANQQPRNPQPITDLAKKAAFNKWLSGSSYSYFLFIREMAERKFHWPKAAMTSNEQRMALMLHHDLRTECANFKNVEESLLPFGKDADLCKEVEELMKLLIDQVKSPEIDNPLPYEQPLKVHGRYTREQILTAFGFQSLNTKRPSQSGVEYNPGLNTELLFVNLEKTERHFSPSTMYEDYAISDTLFHWQSQNSARPEVGMGLSYVQQSKLKKHILLFVREQPKTEFGQTQGFVFLGRVFYRSHEGRKPMNIIWELETPIPAFLRSDSKKLALG